MAVQEQRTLPAQFVEDLGKDLAKQITAQTGVPIVTGGIGSISQQAGETAAGFKARQDAAKAFTTRQQSLAGLAPQIAGQDPLQAQAQKVAEAGIGSFQPFLNQAQTAGTAAGTALSGIQLGAPTTQQVQDFMSPYQSQVIDATLSEFDRNTQMQQQSIRDQQAALGALGSGRAGVQLAEFGTGAARERALLQAGLLQQGFGQAQGARQQDIANRFGLGQAQAGLAGQQAGLAAQRAGLAGQQAGFAGQRGALAGATQGLGAFRSGLAGQQAQLGGVLQGLQGADVTRLGQLGSINQAQRQAELDAQREATRMAAFQPQEELNRFADITTGIMGGMRGTGAATTNVPNPTPLQTALGVGSTLAGIYGAFNPRPLFAD